MFGLKISFFFQWIILQLLYTHLKETNMFLNIFISILIYLKVIPYLYTLKQQSKFLYKAK